MISENDKHIILSWAKKFNVGELFLFSSSLEKRPEANDIDLAVRGIAPDDFYDFDGKLLRHLSKPVDVVNLASSSRIGNITEKNGIKIYERSS